MPVHKFKCEMGQSDTKRLFDYITVSSHSLKSQGYLESPALAADVTLNGCLAPIRHQHSCPDSEGSRTLYDQAIVAQKQCQKQETPTQMF